MKAKYLSLLLAATLVGGTPALAKEKQNKPKTEQTKKAKKGLFGKKKKAAQQRPLQCDEGEERVVLRDSRQSDWSRIPDYRPLYLNSCRHRQVRRRASQSADRLFPACS